LNALSFKKRFQASRFFLGEQAVAEPVILNHRRIFILPTARGLGFALLMALLLFIAFVYSNNLVYLLTFLLAGIYVITILHSFKSLAGLIVQEGHCKSVFAGEAAEFVIHISNPADIARWKLTIGKQEQQSLTIKPNSKAQATVYSITQKRGWHEAGTITLSSTFPLGLFRAWSPIRFNFKALVYPKPSPLEIPFPDCASASRSKQGGGNKGGDDFNSLQEYQAGDAIKRIHWKAFAKGQGLYSKQYGGESPEELWLDYDYTPGQNVEERLSLLCRWVIDAEKAGVPYGLSLPGLKLAPGCGEAHIRKCLEALALF
jgi:uncharacterized protein (DUF58 family)